MTAVVLAHAKPAPRNRLGLSETGWLIVLVTALGLALRIYQLSRPGMLLGTSQYDDAVYFGSAVRLVDGLIPYRDFVIVHPPALPLLLTPVALLSKLTGTDTGLAVARVLTVCAASTSVALGGLLVRRSGRVAVLLACGILAVHPDAVVSAQSVFLEPWLVLFCLLGCLAAFADGVLTESPQRLGWTGIAFGVACAVKVWAALPVLVLGALLVLAGGWRRLRPFAAGLVATLIVVVGPFLAAAPGAFARDVIVAQLGRVDTVHTAAHLRLESIFGLTPLSLPAGVVVAIGVAILVLGPVAMAAVVALSGSRPEPVWVLATLTLWLAIAMFLWAPDYYPHYAAFSTPFLALAVALPAGRLLDALPVGGRISAWRAEIAVMGALVAALVAGALLVRGQEARLRASGRPVALAAKIPSGACVLTDWPDFSLTAERFTSAAGGCSAMVDPVGTDYALSHGRNALTGAGKVHSVQAMWLSAFQHAQYVWLSCAPPGAASCDGAVNRRIPWTPAVLGYFVGHFRRLAEGPGYLYRRTAA